ncbi:MAG: YdcF family protein, partial [Oscillospiraceae bacterium]|nr:YdcF family protein [Oscillospiraceae bacterium]
RNTWENVNNTFALMKREGWYVTDDVLLVSSGFHLARIQMLWSRRWNQYENTYFIYNDQQISTLAAPCSHAPSRVQMFFREPLALVKSFLFDR